MSSAASIDKKDIANRLKDAILGNSPPLVSKLLDIAKDDPIEAFYNFPYVALKGPGGEEIGDFTGKTFATHILGRPSCPVSFLHIAIYNAANNNQCPIICYNTDVRPIEILQMLLDYAKVHWKTVTKLCHSFVIFNVKRWPFTYKGYTATAEDFAIRLKTDIKNDFLDESKRIRQQLDLCIDALIKHDRKMEALAAEAANPLKVKPIKTVPVPESIANTLKSLLFAEKFADVVFEVRSAGGATDRIHAHKCILASSSQFMEVMLTGPWCENKTDGPSVIKPVQSALTIKALLRFIYTGKVDAAAIVADPMEMLDVAAQHGCVELTSACEVEAAKALSTKNVVSTILIAYLHELSALKEACIKFIKNNTVAMMMSSSFMKIKRTHKHIWSDLRVALGAPEEEEEEEDSDEEEQEGEKEKQEGSDDDVLIVGTEAPKTAQKRPRDDGTDNSNVVTPAAITTEMATGTSASKRVKTGADS